MAHLTDSERAIRKGAKKIKKIEAELAAQKGKLEEVKAVEALIERVAIVPLEEALTAAQQKVAECDRKIAESNDRMANLRKQLAASKAKAK